MYDPVVGAGVIVDGTLVEIFVEEKEVVFVPALEICEVVVMLELDDGVELEVEPVLELGRIIVDATEDLDNVELESSALGANPSMLPAAIRIKNTWRAGSLDMFECHIIF
jgi:hypothetical protein